MNTKKRRIVTPALALLFGLVAGQTSTPVQAAAVSEFATTGVLSAPVGFDLAPLPELVPGPYVATLTDLEFPAPFDLLAMGVSSGDGLEGLVFLNGGGPASASFTFDAVSGSEYFLGVVGVPGTFNPGAGLPSIQLGSYSVSISAVPIPAAVLLMGSALLGLVLLVRRQEPGPLPA